MKFSPQSEVTGVDRQAALSSFPYFGPVRVLSHVGSRLSAPLSPDRKIHYTGVLTQDNNETFIET